jgi:uridine kinase
MLILITGAAGSGKTTISSLLSKTDKCIVVSQDSFYDCKFDLFPFDKNKGNEFELPDIINWEKLLNVVKVLIKENVRVIVEGHCVCENEDLMTMADYVFFLSIPKKLCKDRFMKRNSDNLSKQQLDIKEKYFEDYTWVTHVIYTNKIIKNYFWHEKFVIIYGHYEGVNIISTILNLN